MAYLATANTEQQITIEQALQLLQDAPNDAAADALSSGGSDAGFSTLLSAMYCKSRSAANATHCSKRSGTKRSSSSHDLQYATAACDAIAHAHWKNCYADVNTVATDDAEFHRRAHSLDGDAVETRLTMHQCNSTSYSSAFSLAAPYNLRAHPCVSTAAGLLAEPTDSQVSVASEGLDEPRTDSIDAIQKLRDLRDHLGDENVSLRGRYYAAYDLWRRLSLRNTILREEVYRISNNQPRIGSFAERLAKVVMLGDSGCGKTSLATRCAGHQLFRIHAFVCAFHCCWYLLFSLTCELARPSSSRRIVYCTTSFDWNMFALW